MTPAASLKPQPLSADELLAFVHALFRPAALVELGVLGGCLLAAWAIARAVVGRDRAPGVWLSRNVFDSALFPVLALLFALLAHWLLAQLWTGHRQFAVFRLAVPMLVSLAVIRLTARVLRASFPNSPAVRAVERSVSWLAWIGVVLWITGLLPLLLAELDEVGWKVGATRLSLRNIIEGTLSAGLVMMTALWLSSLVEARLLRGAGSNVSLRKMAANALRALLLLVGLMFALSAAGIDLTALGVMGGALGVGIGLGLQKLASNYVSGFVVLAERAVRIGDLVKVDNFEGRITDITMRYTLIRANNGREAIVPNEMMVIQRVENLSLADTKLGLNTSLLVGHGTDLPALAPKIAAAVAAVPRVLDKPAPDVQLQAIVPAGLELSIAFTIADPLNGQANVRSAVNLAAWRVLQAEGVAIPRPPLAFGPPPNAA